MSNKDIWLREYLNIGDTLLGENARELFDKSNKDGKKPMLEVELKASHSGVLINKRVYPSAAMKAGLKTWTKPYKRPVLNKHPSFSFFGDGGESDPIGRVTSSEFIPHLSGDSLTNDWMAPKPRGSKGSGFTLLTVSIGDVESQEMILDGRLQTVSIGARANKMMCSICSSDWIENGPCDHRPGEKYKVGDGKKKRTVNAYLISGILDNDHIAFVNTPADALAGVVSAGVMDCINDEFLIDEIQETNLGSVVLVDSDGSTQLVSDGEVIPVYRAAIASLPIDFSELDDGVEIEETETDMKKKGKATKVKPAEIDDKDIKDELKDGANEDAVKDVKDTGGDEKGDITDEDSGSHTDNNDGDNVGSSDGDTSDSSTEDIIKESLAESVRILKDANAKLEKKNKELEEAVTLSQDDLTDFQEKRHTQSAEMIIDYRILLGKESFEDSSARQDAVDEIAKRSIDSLTDALTDIRNEFTKMEKSSGKVEKLGAGRDSGVDDSDDERGSVEPDSTVRDDDGRVINGDKKNKKVDTGGTSVKKSIKSRFGLLRTDK